MVKTKLIAAEIREKQNRELNLRLFMSAETAKEFLLDANTENHKVYFRKIDIVIK